MAALLRRIGANLAILAVLYFNVAALLIVTGVRLPRAPSLPYTEGPLPNHWLTERAFRTFDVFDRWSMTNWEMSAWGAPSALRETPPQPTSTMIDLHWFDYFPQSHGEAIRRQWLMSFRNDAPRLTREYSKMAAVMRRLWNEDHPDQQIERVYFYEHTWPKSDQGFYARYEERSTSFVATE